ncbi:class I SAM-dependent methyltransferase [Sutterella wadsworthensis]|uniref:class I SAM-dependent methyltransferase n=1 Tax=Sutterella wadsworthensis TaxID=40545 RepID=UPI003967D59B
MTTTTPISETACVKSSALLGEKVSGYWNTRAEGYSLRTADELSGPRGAHWRERLLSNLRGVPSGGSVLDVGCGPALLAITAHRCGWKAYGCDSSPEMLRRALENAKTAGAEVTFCQCDAAALPFADETFDAVISRNVLWNLPHPERALKEWMRVLKPGGRLLYEDGNHYRHLVDPLFKRHHDNMPAPFGHQPQYMLNVDTSAIDAIAQTLPLTQELRPQWDLHALIDLGFTETQVIEPSLAEVSDPLSGQNIRIVTDFVAAATKPAAAAFSNITAAASMP